MQQKCRCTPCREANRLYSRTQTKRARERDKNPSSFIPADRAREHLLLLQKTGIGLRTVSDISGLKRSSLQYIRRGETKRVARSSEEAILRVGTDLVTETTLVPSGEVWKEVRSLKKQGITKTEIAREMGFTGPGYLTKEVPVMTAYRKQRMMKTIIILKKTLEEGKKVGSICPQCGSSHAPAKRYAAILALLPVSVAALREIKPCWYDGKAGERKLFRDLHKVGARVVEGSPASLDSVWGK